MARGLLAGLQTTAWRTYLPAFAVAKYGTPTPLAQGNGLAVGRYINLNNRLIAFQIQTTMGTGYSAGAGDAYVWSLPVPAARAFPTGPTIIGQAINYHAVTGDAYNDYAPVALADPFTSLAGDENSWCQLWAPQSMTYGTTSIAGTATSATVTHDQACTPSAADIQIRMTAVSGAAGANSAHWYITTIGATTFQLNVKGAPGAGETISYAWKIRGAPTSTGNGSTTPWLVNPGQPWPVTTNQDYFMQGYYEPAA